MGTRLRGQDQRGITLIEILVALAILGILSAFAIPAYQNYVKKAKMVEGETAVRVVATLEDAYYLDTDAYSDDLATIGYSPMPALQYYTVKINLSKSGSDYEVRATGNLDGDTPHDAWVLEKKTDGTTTLRHGCISKVNPQDKLVGKLVFGCTD